MKNDAPKIPRNFRLDAKINEELQRRSEATGITETRIIEDALRFHFAQNMQQQLAKVAASFGKGPKSNPSSPLTPFTNNALTAFC